MIKSECYTNLYMWLYQSFIGGNMYSIYAHIPTRNELDEWTNVLKTKNKLHHPFILILLF